MKLLRPLFLLVLSVVCYFSVYSQGFVYFKNGKAVSVAHVNGDVEFLYEVTQMDPLDAGDFTQHAATLGLTEPGGDIIAVQFIPGDVTINSIHGLEGPGPDLRTIANITHSVVEKVTANIDQGDGTFVIQEIMTTKSVSMLIYGEISAPGKFTKITIFEDQEFAQSTSPQALQSGSIVTSGNSVYNISAGTDTIINKLDGSLTGSGYTTGQGIIRIDNSGAEPDTIYGPQLINIGGSRYNFQGNPGISHVFEGGALYGLAGNRIHYIGTYTFPGGESIAHAIPTPSTVDANSGEPDIAGGDAVYAPVIWYADGAPTDSIQADLITAYVKPLEVNIDANSLFDFYGGASGDQVCQNVSSARHGRVTPNTSDLGFTYVPDSAFWGEDQVIVEFFICGHSDIIQQRIVYNITVPEPVIIDVDTTICLEDKYEQCDRVYTLDSVGHRESVDYNLYTDPHVARWCILDLKVFELTDHMADVMLCSNEEHKVCFRGKIDLSIDESRGSGGLNFHGVSNGTISDVEENRFSWSPDSLFWGEETFWVEIENGEGIRSRTAYTITVPEPRKFVLDTTICIESEFDWCERSFSGDSVGHREYVDCEPSSDYGEAEARWCILNLDTFPRFRNHTVKSICYGDTFNYDAGHLDTLFYQHLIYTENVVFNERIIKIDDRGCQEHHDFDLTFLRPDLEDVHTVTLTAGESYEFVYNGKTYKLDRPTESGNYPFDLSDDKSGSDCPSVIIVRATIVPAGAGVSTVYRCAGKSTEGFTNQLTGETVYPTENTLIQINTDTFVNVVFERPIVIDTVFYKSSEGPDKIFWEGNADYGISLEGPGTFSIGSKRVPGCDSIQVRYEVRELIQKDLKICHDFNEGPYVIGDTSFSSKGVYTYIFRGFRYNLDLNNRIRVEDELLVGGSLIGNLFNCDIISNANISYAEDNSRAVYRVSRKLGKVLYFISSPKNCYEYESFSLHLTAMADDTLRTACSPTPELLDGTIVELENQPFYSKIGDNKNGGTYSFSQSSLANVVLENGEEIFVSLENCSCKYRERFRPALDSELPTAIKNIQICEGSNITLGDSTISAEGSYTLRTPSGSPDCDTMITYHVEYADNPRATKTVYRHKLTSDCEDVEAITSPDGEGSSVSRSSILNSITCTDTIFDTIYQESTIECLPEETIYICNGLAEYNYNGNFLEGFKTHRFYSVPQSRWANTTEVKIHTVTLVDGRSKGVAYIYDTICPGAVYENGPFRVETRFFPEGQVVSQQESIKNDGGCDSIVNLRLFIESSKDELTQTICSGGDVVYNGDTILRNLTTDFNQTIFLNTDGDCGVELDMNITVRNPRMLITDTFMITESSKFNYIDGYGMLGELKLGVNLKPELIVLDGVCLQEGIFVASENDELLEERYITICENQVATYTYRDRRQNLNTIEFYIDDVFESPFEISEYEGTRNVYIQEGNCQETDISATICVGSQYEDDRLPDSYGGSKSGTLHIIPYKVADYTTSPDRSLRQVYNLRVTTIDCHEICPVFNFPDCDAECYGWEINGEVWNGKSDKTFSPGEYCTMVDPGEKIVITRYGLSEGDFSCESDFQVGDCESKVALSSESQYLCEDIATISISVVSDRELTHISWSGPGLNNEESKSINAEEPGVYNVVVTDIENCIQSNSVEIKVVDDCSNIHEPECDLKILEISSEGKSMLCPDSEETISLSAIVETTNDMVVSYSWSSNVDQYDGPNAKVSEPGTYSVIAFIGDGNDCIDGTEITISAKPCEECEVPLPRGEELSDFVIDVCGPGPESLEIYFNLQRALALMDELAESNDVCSQAMFSLLEPGIMDISDTYQDLNEDVSNCPTVRRSSVKILDCDGLKRVAVQLQQMIDLRNKYSGLSNVESIECDDNCAQTRAILDDIQSGETGVFFANEDIDEISIQYLTTTLDITRRQLDYIYSGALCQELETAENKFNKFFCGTLYGKKTYPAAFPDETCVGDNGIIRVCWTRPYNGSAFLSRADAGAIDGFYGAGVNIAEGINSFIDAVEIYNDARDYILEKMLCAFLFRGPINEETVDCILGDSWTRDKCPYLDEYGEDLKMRIRTASGIAKRCAQLSETDKKITEFETNLLPNTLNVISQLTNELKSYLNGFTGPLADYCIAKATIQVVLAFAGDKALSEITSLLSGGGRRIIGEILENGITDGAILRKHGKLIDTYGIEAYNNLPNGLRKDFVGRPADLEKFLNKTIPVQAWEKMFAANVPDDLRKNIGALEALSLPHGSRPAPSTYLSEAFIAAHQAKFDDGIVRFTTQARIEEFGGTLGSREAFTIAKSEFDRLLLETGRDLVEVEIRLGLTPGTLTGEDVVVAWVKREDLGEIKIPSGNEGGVNENWIPGGFTSGGFTEGVVDLTDPEIPYTPLDLN